MEHIGVFRGSSAMGCESADRLLSSTSARSAVGMGIPMGMGMRWIWGGNSVPTAALTSAVVVCQYTVHILCGKRQKTVECLSVRLSLPSVDSSSSGGRRVCC